MGIIKQKIEPWQESSFVLYEDDGVSNEYINGEYCKTNITVMPKDGNVELSFNAEGSYASNYKAICLEVICKEVAPISVAVEGKKLRQSLDRAVFEKLEEGFFYEPEKRSILIKYKKTARDYTVFICFDTKDLISI